MTSAWYSDAKTLKINISEKWRKKSDNHHINICSHAVLFGVAACERGAAA